MSWMESLYEHSPVFVDSGQGSHFTDVDGHTYLDMYIGELSGFCGHASPAGRRGGHPADRAREPLPAARGGRSRRRGSGSPLPSREVQFTLRPFVVDHPAQRVDHPAQVLVGLGLIS